MLSHAFENKEGVEHIDSVQERVVDIVLLEIYGREEHVLELSFISIEMGHDLHSDV